MIIRKKNALFFFNLFIVLCLLLSSCSQLDTFEKDTSIPKHEWKSSFTAQGDFSITDTASMYNAYIVIRHTDAYKYNNLWLNIGTQAPADSMTYQKFNVELVKNEADGWEGTGMNDIWEIRKLFIQGIKFKKTGNYNFAIAQIMRDDPLPAIMSAGLRLEKQ